MNIHIRRVDEKLHFEARNGRSNTVHIDGASGNDTSGMRPMELLLVSVGSCSSIDVVEILKKQRQQLNDLRVNITGKRPEDTAPRPFKSIDIHFILYGNLEDSKVARAVGLAVEKYCSVAETLSPDVEISHSFEIKPGQVAADEQE